MLFKEPPVFFLNFARFKNPRGLFHKMALKYREFSHLNLPAIEQEILEKWEQEEAFTQSMDLREGAPPFVFYEGPPSANGMPGIHHVISRTLKDLVCRYKTMQGYQVKRKISVSSYHYSRIHLRNFRQVP